MRRQTGVTGPKSNNVWDRSVRRSRSKPCASSVIASSQQSHQLGTTIGSGFFSLPARAERGESRREGQLVAVSSCAQSSETATDMARVSDDQRIAFAIHASKNLTYDQT